MSTGRAWVNACSQILSHIVIVLSCVIAVICLCDLIGRGEMGLINNVGAKAMIFALCALSCVNALANLSGLRRLRALRKYFRLKSR